MSEKPSEMGPDPRAEIEALLAANPNASAMYAFQELHAGRLEWLAEHIRRCDSQIDPMVARKLLELIDGSHPEYAIRMVRSKKRNPKAKLRTQRDLDDLELALEVARSGGFERAKLTHVCADVGEKQAPKVAGLTVQRRVRRFRSFALKTLEMEEGPGMMQSEKDHSDGP